jgi:hypothetical protein
LALYASSQTQQYHAYEWEGEGFAVAVLFVGTSAPQEQKRHPSNLPTLRRNKSKQNIVPSPVKGIYTLYRSPCSRIPLLEIRNFTLVPFPLVHFLWRSTNQQNQKNET